MSTLGIRLLGLIQTKIQGGKRFKQLEELTGIGARRWNAFSLGSQQPTIEMVEAVCKVWPQHAFWLTTGIEDSKTGHTNPEESNFLYEFVEALATAIFTLKLQNNYTPENLGMFFRSKDELDKEFGGESLATAHHFDHNGYIDVSKINIDLLCWLSLEEKMRPVLELENARIGIISNQEVSAKKSEIFFGKINGKEKVKLLEPYLSQVLRLQKATTFNDLDEKGTGYLLPF